MDRRRPSSPTQPSNPTGDGNGLADADPVGPSVVVRFLTGTSLHAGLSTAGGTDTADKAPAALHLTPGALPHAETW